ncbi:MAG: Rnf-Nqr domain containing protein, partial [Gammaproteobacteria bacterium]
MCLKAWCSRPDPGEKISSCCLPIAVPSLECRSSNVPGDTWFILIVGLVSSELLLTNLIGVCPLLAVTKKLETAAGLAAAILLVQPIAL